MTYLKHAWDSTNSWWGKVSLVLFYVYVWLMIISGIYSLFYPLSGLGCLFDDVEADAGGPDETLAAGLTRGINLFLVAWLFYVDKSGLHSSNVGFVAVVTVIWYWMWYSILDGSFEGCAAIWSDLAWIWLVWIVLAFVTIVIDERMPGNSGDADGAGERQPLNSK
eukprot:CAMPEP_0113473808 /NCGR_PEP_ID=MMETSP0014_2-20120614/18242_1 /TAXON_ID=2857 /ORGANISM="Nitzschia sp." /LENGTH=164 /DNA_ID=CAMNT_0000366601 /DNA_START=479 /DNA_END=973 /DNA_ORIENTATION=+ /assembly_acc=CAM_ASM_000159